MQYGLRPLLLKTNFETEKVQHGKKMEFRLGDTAIEAFSFKRLSDFTPFLDEVGEVRNRFIGVNLGKIDAFWFGMGSRLNRGLRGLRGLRGFWYVLCIERV